MSYVKTVHKVVLASPGDVSNERDMVRITVAELDHAIRDSGVGLELYDWETDAYPGFHARGPQGIIDDVLKISESDILIAVFHRRVGSGGTEHEIGEAIRSWEERRLPHILIYFKELGSEDLNSMSKASIEQLARVRDFQKKIPAECLYSEFKSVADFGKKLRMHLSQLLKRLPPAPAVLPAQDGYVRFYTPGSQDDRPRDKKDRLAQEDKLVRLVAHVGRSYLAEQTALFRADVEALLERGVSFRLIAQNPWSEVGLAIALAEPQESVAKKALAENGPWDTDAMVEAIGASKYYTDSLLPVLDQIDLFQKRYGELMTCRLSDLDIPATCLITSEAAFFEPYVTVNLKQRFSRFLHTFEVQLTESCPLYQNLSDWFDSTWRVSVPVKQFRLDEDIFRNGLLNRYRDRVNKDQPTS